MESNLTARIGKVVIVIERGKQLGYTTLGVNEIYKFNIGSRLFESLGFRKYEETEMVIDIN